MWGIYNDFMKQDSRFSVLSSNILKIIAMVSMTIDHSGLLLFGNRYWMRAVGRLAFPIYAFLISEGCSYTKNRNNYFLRLFILGCICQLFAFFVGKEALLNILLTFSASVILIYLADAYSDDGKVIWVILFSLVVLTVTIGDTCNIMIGGSRVSFDYGLPGVLVPLVCYKTKNTRFFYPAFIVILLILAYSMSGIQLYSLFAIPVIYMYNGKRGEHNLKNFFYLYYPIHLALIYAIQMIIPAE